MMAALRPTLFHGEIVFLGVLAPDSAGLSRPVERLELGFGGVQGDARHGLTRASCTRVSGQHPEGTEIANVRQLAILSEEELAETAFAMRIVRFQPEWARASVVLRGLPDLTHLPPSSRLQGPDGATLVVDMENRPLADVAAVIDAQAPGVGARYLPAAQRRSGVTAWVERPGVLEMGQSLTLHVPDQRAWERLSDVRG